MHKSSRRGRHAHRSPTGVRQASTPLDFDPVAEGFEYCFAWALGLIDLRQEPAWFRDTFGNAEDQKSLSEYGMPTNTLVALGLAYHLTLGLPPPPIKEVRRALDAEWSHLQKVLGGVRKLGQYHLPFLRPECLSNHRSSDGGLELQLAPDPIDELSHAIIKFSTLLTGGVLEAEKSGRRISAHRYVVGRLQNVAKRHNPSLTPTQVKDLCHLLLDPIRKYHGHKCGSPTADEDEMPRYDDVLSRGRRIGRKSA